MLRPLPMADVLVLSGALALASDPTVLVICAPGYPSNTEEAQPTMDRLARSVERAAAWGPGRVNAVYHPTVDGGIEALAEGGAELAITPLPFYLEYRERLDLSPILRVVQASGDSEVWSLVARRGAVGGAGSLSGWQIGGMSGYSPRFVRRIALAEWQALPDDATIEFSSRVLGLLRKAARGDPVAALLDLAQTEALESLPYASELEVVARSRPLVASLLCRVGPRLSDETTGELKSAFLGLERLEGGRKLLDTLRISRFEPIDPETIRPIERAFADEASPR